MTDSRVTYAAAITGTVATYPLDTWNRMRQASSRGNLELLRGIASPRVVYKGLVSALATQPTFWTLYLALYDAGKRRLGDAGIRAQMALSYGSSAVAVTVTNPLWVLRQRMQTETLRNKRLSYAQLVRELYAENGLRTFFRGNAVTLVKNLQLSFVVPFFDRWTAAITSKTGAWGAVAERVGEAPAVALAGMWAKVLASTVVYPIDVVRTNLRSTEGPRVTVPGVLAALLVQPGGPRNLYRGVATYWLSTGASFSWILTARWYLTERTGTET